MDAGRARAELACSKFASGEGGARRALGREGEGRGAWTDGTALADAVPLLPCPGLEGQKREAGMGTRLEVVSAPRRFGVRIHHRGTESTVSRRGRSRERVRGTSVDIYFC